MDKDMKKSLWLNGVGTPILWGIFDAFKGRSAEEIIDQTLTIVAIVVLIVWTYKGLKKGVI